EVFVQPQRPGNAARNRGRLERVGHARAVVVAGRVDEDLRLTLEAAERLRVEDAVPVALERCPEPAVVFLAQTAARLVRAHGERGDPPLFVPAHLRLEGAGHISGYFRHAVQAR